MAQGTSQAAKNAVVGQEPFLDALYNGASKLGFSRCVFEVLRKLSDELQGVRESQRYR
jgi:hypothetical protein